MATINQVTRLSRRSISDKNRRWEPLVLGRRGSRHSPSTGTCYGSQRLSVAQQGMRLDIDVSAAKGNNNIVERP